MNREIKFRAWAHASKKMFYPDTEDGWELKDGMLMVLSNTILMQYIGLLDKNGKEIYEGDIVKSPDYDNQMIVEYQDVQASDDMTAPGMGFQFNTEPEDMEVIGNIYENPELLNHEN